MLLTAECVLNYLFAGGITATRLKYGSRILQLFRAWPRLKSGSRRFPRVATSSSTLSAKRCLLIVPRFANLTINDFAQLETNVI